MLPFGQLLIETQGVAKRRQQESEQVSGMPSNLPTRSKSSIAVCLGRGEGSGNKATPSDAAFVF